jgi:murein DD-endopeptidase MepM/ murein hydrolase activator NlpD
MRWIVLGAVLSVLLWPGPSRAGSVKLDGPLTQGALVIGTTEPGTEAQLDGRVVRVSPEGRFLLGFGRDAPPQMTLDLAFPDGSSARRTLEIAARQYDIQRVDGLPPDRVSQPPEVLERIQRETALVAEARKVDRPQALFESGFVWPVTGPITGIFGSQRVLNGEPRRPHFGVDVAAPEGTPVTAPADGVVLLAHPDMYFSGGTVIIDHGHGLSSAYLHMKEVWVGEGDRLGQGDPIGTVGATGRVTGAHLDWRFNWFEERLDPMLIVGPMPE